MISCASSLVHLIVWGAAVPCYGRLWDRPKIDWSLGPCKVQLHESCSTNSKIKYYLYTVGNPGSPTSLVNFSKRDLPQSYNATLPLKVLIHGFSGTPQTDYTATLRKAYLSAGGVNVLVVDWSHLSARPCYPAASFNTIQVAQCTTEMLELLRTTPNSIHIVGFSLGAHIGAYISNQLAIHNGSRIARITGLDPALPLFATMKVSWKLDPNDADFVDVVHTNTGMFGKIEPSGHVDFYMNGGTFQPMCDAHRNPPLCSHMMAPLFFAESITSNMGFWGSPCDTYFELVYYGSCRNTTQTTRVMMGEHINQKVRGVYAVPTRTSRTPPYALS